MALDFPASPTTGDRVTLNSVIYEFDGAKWVTIRSLFDRGQFVAGTAAEPGLSVSTDANTGLYAPGADQLAFTTGGVERVEFGTSEVVFNDGGIDYDFRIEGDADVNLVFADASTDRIGIGTSAPSVKVDIEASEPYVTLKNTTEEDTDGGREVRIDFEGEQSGGEASTLARIEVSHDGAADDEKGKVVISTNDGADAATPTTAVTIDSEQKVTIAGDLETNTINTLIYPDAGPLSNRNLIINGAMQVAERSTSETGVGGGGYHTLDRFRMSGISDGFGTVSLDQSTDVPANQGFVSSFKVECTTSPGNPYPSFDAAFIDQRIEAQNLQHLKYGTANAENVTVSFWAKASEGGTYCLCIHQDDPNKSYVKEYTLESGVWKYVSLTFPGNTADAITNDNGVGFIVAWMLSAGSVNQMSADAWATPPNATGINGTANQNQLFDTAGAEFYLTGVQLEVGSKSTPFEHRSYSDELARCQRYFYKISGSTVDQVSLGTAYCYQATNGDEHVRFTVPFPVTMRTDVAYSGAELRGLISGSTDIQSNSSSGLDESSYACGIDVGFTSSSLALYNAIQIRLQNTATSHVSFNAEL